MTKRIYELAKELDVSSKDLVSTATAAGYDVKNHMSTIDDKQEQDLKKRVQQGSAGKAKPATKSAEKKPADKASAKKAPKAEASKAPEHKSEAKPKASAKATTQTKSAEKKPATHGSNQGNNNQHQGNQHQQNGGQRQQGNAKGKGGQNNGPQNRNNNNNGRNQNRNGNWNNNHGKKGQRGQNRNNQRHNEPRPAAPQRKEQPLPEVLNYTVGMNVQDIAKLIHRDATEIIKKLFMLGVMVNQNQSLDADTIELLATDYGIEAKEKVEVDHSDIDKIFEEEANNDENLQPRAPVVTIMGHVDHGKTTLLDYLRHSHVTDGEAGGITQHIGAYQVKADGREITFLDTPGHAAFTEMRARGANITDITILVVAADDGVMPQTVEAIHHAKAAGTPIIVAVNKIDKPGANPENVINQLMQYELIPEEYGGDTIFVNISAKYGENIDELLDMVLLTADVMDLKANPDQRAAGSVVEARLDKGRGSVATVLVQQGTMHVGDPIVVGNTYGRVRTMTNDRGRRIKEAVPSTPVEITGLNDVPSAGDRFVVFEDEKTARAAGEERQKRALLEDRNRNNVVSVSDLFNKMAEENMKSVPVIIKADVQGSVEALTGSLQKIDVDGVKVDIIHTAVGAINESDVTLAEASGAIIIGFNVRPTPQAKAQAESEDVDIRLHSVIYNVIDEIEAAMKGQLDPEYKEEIIGTADVRELFKVSKVGTIVGGMVTSGKITSDASVRLIRDGIVIFDGKLNSLRRYKDDVKEVKNGYDFGLTIENYNDEKIGDVIEAYEMVEIKR
ncbi:translation initiation factor IF-2 [Weissella uvarum]|uniref:translation initiation factor IF-2 n=1 Tax=Weissella uvarum TaxID=1479233 RepID=UPI0019602F0D|nr:translation initiation factor IF-2 [Weissella uvarum]MBM7617573.1 translation initiation factor IF-2 [Weissella uvarum]MCM0595545.1 translation initiation factor IF-2 [Weissella uvarum]